MGSKCWFLLIFLQVENEFILLLEREMFIEQLKEIMEKAEDILNEDADGEKASVQNSPLRQMPVTADSGPQVRPSACFIQTCFRCTSYRVLKYGHT